MKKNKLKEKRDLKPEELKKEADSLSAQLVKIRLEIASGRLKNKRAAKNLRRDRAQILSIIKEKQ